jgi:tRNA (guanine-N7-)-methyltransferase
LTEPERAGAFHGRRKGKRLRGKQEERLRTLLPTLRIPVGTSRTIDLPGLFGNLPERVVLEIGFGGGEHLAAEAAAHPAAGFIGCEPFVNGMAKLLGLAAQRGLSNIRVWDDDATALLAALPAASLDLVYLLYPDPWPKRRQRKRRFVSAESLGMIVRALKPGGEFRFATDIDGYAGWTLARAAANPALRWKAERASDWREPWEGWTSTRYETKARGEGRRSSYLTFVRA